MDIAVQLRIERFATHVLYVIKPSDVLPKAQSGWDAAGGGGLQRR